MNILLGTQFAKSETLVQFANKLDTARQVMFLDVCEGSLDEWNISFDELTNLARINFEQNVIDHFTNTY